MEYIVFIIGVCLFVFLLLGKWFWDDRKAKKLFLLKLKRNYGTIEEKKYGQDRFQIITRYFAHHKKEGQIDDITWNDLNGDALFGKINTSLSSALSGLCAAG